ncbi:hypothetical protein C4D60_Mb06t11250 [Musa balbisiana]|uniref:ABC transporter domain-containing protein n=1 Tax=Musa balbisiana TaxID=52838 RepID=A0A4S8IME5_MUSBA|nr:hypothetical protein C4D60_Mb06t11250 [Musa balbisiana]
MDLSTKLQTLDLRSGFLSGSPLLDAGKARILPRACPSSVSPALSRRVGVSFVKKAGFTNPRIRKLGVLVRAAVDTAIVDSDTTADLESLFSETAVEDASARQGRKRSSSGASSVSSGVRLENISKSFKGVTLLKDVSWEVKKGEKVGLVGVNGAGKTTQLRIIAGLEEPDSGNVVKAKENMKIAFLSQEFEVCPSRTVNEEFLNAFKEEMEIAERLDKVQRALESSVEDLSLMGRLLDELDLLQRRAQDLDLDEVDVKISKLMPELGFAPEDSDRLVASFSSGWQMRMSLGKILLQEEMEIAERLDRTLTYCFSMSQLITLIWTQLSGWMTFLWVTCHVCFLTLSDNYHILISCQKLEKLQGEGQVEKPFLRKQLKIRFPERGRSGRTVLTIKNLNFGYDDKVLFKRANLLVERGEKIAIIGPNGCGKSTLLKLIMGLEKPQGGDVLLGEHNVLPNYFEQNQAEALDLEKTVLETVEEAAEDWRIDDIKGLLGRCNFKSDMLDRKVSLLSGGEKARLAFCKFMVKPSTLLVLDEPTNHLDIPSKEMLEEAISEYQGTVITVSHDRYFIRQIVNRVVEVKDGSLQDYAGDYNYYLENNLEARERELEREAELEEKAPKIKAKSKMSKEEKEARKKQKMLAFQQAKAKSKGLKNAKRWK